MVTLLVRDTAGAGSLLGLADCVDEAFPILLLLQGDFDPLAKRAIVDCRIGLAFVDFHKVGSFQIRKNPQKPFIRRNRK